MKTLAKSLFFSLVATAATGVLAADMTSKLVTFSTTEDHYADGETVIDGEWYALCWSPTETFGGMDADCQPLVEGQEVLRVASLAKGGKCPPVVFVLDGAKAKTTGNFFVYLLDTRTAAKTVAVDADKDGLPDIVNGAAAADYKANAAAESVGEFDVATASPTVTDAFVTTPASLEIVTTGAGAKVTAVNLNPLVKYSIKYGKTLGTWDGEAAFAERGKFDSESSVTFSFEDASFFKLSVAE